LQSDDVVVVLRSISLLLALRYLLQCRASATHVSQDVVACVSQPGIDPMKRREFVLTLGAAAAWPLALRGQQPKKVPLVGVLWPNPPAQFEFIRQPLADLGYIEGKNIRFEFRWAEGALDSLPELAMELVRIPVDLMITLAPPATLAAQRATQTIPIVFVAMGDPLASGVVASLARPGANLTGTTRMISEMSAKHVQLLKEIYPALSNLAVLWNPNNSSHPPALRAVESSTRSLSLQIQPFEVRAATDLEDGFAAAVRGRANGLLFIADPIFFIHLKRVADFVAANRLPAIGNFLEFPKLGGLIGYAPSLPDEYRHAANHIDKILKGAKPSDLPVEQPTKFQLVINVKAARTLGLDVPPTLLASADELIE
jgi:putative tryptophan/tyrosine transport system substrate-binding protein